MTKPHLPTAPHRVRVADQTNKMIELRKAGMSYARIGEALGCSVKNVHDGIKRGLKLLVEEPARELRQLELERLDALMLGVWKQAKDGHLGAIDRVLKIQERRAKLLGLDAPSKVSIEDAPMPVMVNVQVVDASKADGGEGGGDAGGV